MVASKPPRKVSGSVSSQNVISTLWQSYMDGTSPRLRLIDTFLSVICLMGVLQFLYCLLITNFPFNAFLGGFASTVGQFVLLAGLRIQSDPENKALFRPISEERYASSCFSLLCGS
jgi:oligosaccharyltransferase complex subunit epsilon